MTDDLDQLDAALRRDIRRLGTQLGDTLVRQVGPDLLEQVEQVRTLARALREGDDSVGEELTDRLGNTDVVRAIELVRAFTTYFHLANTAEQVHRIDDLAENRTTRSKRIAETVSLVELGFTPNDVAAAVNKVQLYPVFTAHPTEASRRSILDKLAEVALLIEQRMTENDEPVVTRIDRRIDELLDMIWQTDELRRENRSRRRGPIHPVFPRRDAGGGGAGTPRRHRRSPSLPRFPARCCGPAGALRVVGRR